MATSVVIFKIELDEKVRTSVLTLRELGYRLVEVLETTENVSQTCCSPEILLLDA